MRKTFKCWKKKAKLTRILVLTFWQKIVKSGGNTLSIYDRGFVSRIQMLKRNKTTEKLPNTYKTVISQVKMDSS